jgi:serine/threonine-protein kinase
MRLGRYKLDERLAVGGMAEVFRGRQLGPGGFEKVVAVKRTLPHLSSSREFVQMFMDEARIAALLDHPHITHIYDFGSADGLYYIAMEYVPGVDLRALIEQAGRKPGSIPADMSATILIAACDALHYAHERKNAEGQPLGIVHRDITPSNLLVTFDGTVKIADFGIAKAKLRASRAQTAVGAVKGTYAYMSPEQARGEDVDRRSDLWSLGVCGWELVTGQRLFLRDGEPATVAAVLSAPVPDPREFQPSLPAELAAVLLRALERDPNARFASAQAMQLALEAQMRAAQVTPSKILIARRVRRLFRERRGWRGTSLPPSREPTARLAAQGPMAQRSLRMAAVRQVSASQRKLLAAALTLCVCATVWVTRRADPRAAVPPPPAATATATAALDIATDPPGAAVFMDGVLRGASPITVGGISPGVHTVLARRPGHADYSQTVRVQAGARQPLRLLLSQLGPHGALAPASPYQTEQGLAGAMGVPGAHFQASAKAGVLVSAPLTRARGGE